MRSSEKRKWTLEKINKIFTVDSGILTTVQLGQVHVKLIQLIFK